MKIFVFVITCYNDNFISKILGSIYLEDTIKCEIIDLLTETETKINELAHDRYGNYVLQKCLEIAGTEKIDVSN